MTVDDSSKGCERKSEKVIFVCKLKKTKAQYSSFFNNPLLLLEELSTVTHVVTRGGVPKQTGHIKLFSNNSDIA